MDFRIQDGVWLGQVQEKEQGANPAEPYKKRHGAHPGILGEEPGEQAHEQGVTSKARAQGREEGGRGRCSAGHDMGEGEQRQQKRQGGEKQMGAALCPGLANGAMLDCGINGDA